MGIEAINSKFNWARHHFELLYSELANYMEVNPCKFVPKQNVTTDENGRQWVTGTFEAARPVPEKLSHIIGDCLGNLRSCLDYLVWELVLANGKKPVRKNAFPVAISTQAYADEIKRARLQNVDPGAAAVIDKFQPYHVGVAANESLLAVLNEFVNINKHRRILLTTLKTIGPVPNMQFAGTQAFAMVDPPTIQGNAEFGPFEVFGNQVKLEAEIVAYIAFDEAPAKDFGVYGIIEAIARFLDAEVFPQFERFL